jgi:hypothetical protein
VSLRRSRVPPLPNAAANGLSARPGARDSPARPAQHTSTSITPLRQLRDQSNASPARVGPDQPPVLALSPTVGGSSLADLRKRLQGVLLAVESHQQRFDVVRLEATKAAELVMSMEAEIGCAGAAQGSWAGRGPAPGLDVAVGPAPECLFLAPGSNPAPRHACSTCYLWGHAQLAPSKATLCRVAPCLGLWRRRRRSCRGECRPHPSAPARCWPAAELLQLLDLSSQQLFPALLLLDQPGLSSCGLQAPGQRARRLRGRRGTAGPVCARTRARCPAPSRSVPLQRISPGSVSSRALRRRSRTPHPRRLQAVRLPACLLCARRSAPGWPSAAWRWTPSAACYPPSSWS